MWFPRVAASFAALMVLTPPPQAGAQEALVLSGGGSRGLAHVGVLMRLGELGYDPDLVVGNSMGAVIGALYAAGFSPAEIRHRVEAVKWSGMFSPMPVVSGPAQAVRLPMLGFDLNVTERRLSRGLFGEWRINRALTHLLFDANARARGDFDRLPRRFRAVAADLESGEPVVLESGDLARAVRASMAYPGFFAPIEWHDRLLVDGGIADNLPTFAARALGASRIIAVDVSRPAGRISSRAPLSVVQRALNLMQRNLHRDSIPPDALVQLDIESNFTGASFPDDPGPLIEAGYDAAVRDLPAVAASPRSERAALTPPQFLTRVVLDAPDPALAALAADAFESVAPGPYDAAAVLAAVDRLFSSGLIQGVWPRVVDVPGSAGASELHVRIDGAAPVTASLAAGYDNDRGGRLWASLDGHARYGVHPGLRTAAVSLTSLERWGALSTRIHSVSRPGLAFTAGTHLQERTVRTFAEDVTEAVEVWRAGGWLGAELPIHLRRRFITAAIRGEWIDPENAAGAAAFGPLLRIAEVAPDIQVVGEPLLLEGELRWGDISFARYAARASYAFAVPHLRLALVADVRGVSRSAPIDDWPSLGDEHAVPGLRWGDVRGRNRAVGGVDIARRVFDGWTRIRLRSGSVLDDFDALPESRWIHGIEMGVTWPIPLGALRAGWSVATRGDGRVIIDVGRHF